jgi:hypothetical protein
LSLGVAGAWRERWWSADFLLVDGAQALSATERAQEEFFHLFEALLRRQARIMIAGDRPPGQISALDDRLRARLDGGLVIEIEVAGGDLSEAAQAGLEEDVPEALPPAPDKKDISEKDREWIRSFQPARPVPERSLGGAQDDDEGEILEVVAAGATEVPTGEPWIPASEQVVWVWPRLGDRLVEDLD